MSFQLVALFDHLDYSGRVNTVSRSNFGILIAYLLPGFVGLVGASFHLPLLQAWLNGNAEQQVATIGGFLYSTLTALLLGLMFSTARWLIIDTAHHHTGIKPPKRNFRVLQANLGAYRMIEENHYQYYQFYGNTLIAMLVGYASYRFAELTPCFKIFDAVFFLVASLLFLGSRDTLTKYYRRIEQLLADAEPIILVPSQSL